MNVLLMSPDGSLVLSVAALLVDMWKFVIYSMAGLASGQKDELLKWKVLK